MTNNKINWESAFELAYEQEVTALRRQLKSTRKELGKAGTTIFTLRGEVGLLRSREGIDPYLSTLDAQDVEIQNLRAEIQELKYENGLLREAESNLAAQGI